MTAANPEKIEICCPSCQTRIVVAALHGGKQVRCRCQHLVKIPLVARLAQAPSPTSPDSPAPPSADSIPKPRKPDIVANVVDKMTFVCSSCKATLKVKKSDAGKSCRCRCGTTLKIPVEPGPDDAGAQLPDPINKDFDFDFGS